jgi:hypothetical protein
MNELIAAFFVSISLNGVTTSEVGPYPDGGGCEDMKLTIQRSIENSFATETTYGISGDRWGAGGGAILRANNYELQCIRKEL